MSALSNIVTPCSRQRSTSRVASATSVAPHAASPPLPPNVPVPKVSAGTLNPERPNCRYSIVSLQICAAFTEIGVVAATVDCGQAEYCSAAATLRYCHGMKRRVLSDIFTLAGFAVMATMFTSCAAPVPSPASGGPTARSAVEHASADDCAIIAEIGKSELHWSVTNAPQASFYASFETPGGGSYLEDCEWEKLGLAPPLIGTPNSPMRFFITRPAYS